MGLDNLPDVVTVKQLAKFLQINDITVKRALKAGSLKGFKIGRDWRVEKEEVIKWLKTK